MPPDTPYAPIGPLNAPPLPPEQAPSGQEWYYCRSTWHLVSLWVRLMFGQMYPHSHHPLCPPGRGIWWSGVVQTCTPLTWAHVLFSAVFSRPSWVFRSTPPPPVQASSAQEWYYCRSAWHLVRLGQADVWSDLLPAHITPYAPQCPHPYPHPQYRHLVAKSNTPSGQIDIWSAFGSGWPVYAWVNWCQQPQ